MDNFLDLRDGYRGHSADGLTICYQYYDDKAALDNLLEVVETYSDHLLGKVNIQIVDDGSLKHPLRESRTRLSKFGIRAFEIRNDIPWNQAGARNLNAYLAKTKWCVFSESGYAQNEGCQNDANAAFYGAPTVDSSSGADCKLVPACLIVSSTRGSMTSQEKLGSLEYAMYGPRS